MFVVLITAAGILCLGATTFASESTVIPTGATITPDAAPGSVLQTLTVDLPDYPNRAVDGAQTTLIRDRPYQPSVIQSRTLRGFCE